MSIIWEKLLPIIAWTMLRSEAANTELSRIMVMDIQYNDSTRMVDDCIKSLYGWRILKII